MFPWQQLILFASLSSVHDRKESFGETFAKAGLTNCILIISEIEQRMSYSISERMRNVCYKK